MRLDPFLDPFFARAGSAGLTMGDPIPKFTYPSDVTAIKRQIDPQMVATDAAVQQCAALEPGERAAWTDFYRTWREFYAEPEPWFFGSANLYDEARDYRDRLAGWQEQLRKKCAIPGPVVVAEVNELPSSIKWASAALVAVAVAYTVRTVLK